MACGRTMINTMAQENINLDIREIENKAYDIAQYDLYDILESYNTHKGHDTLELCEDVLALNYVNFWNQNKRYPSTEEAREMTMSIIENPVPPQKIECYGGRLVSDYVADGTLDSSINPELPIYKKDISVKLSAQLDKNGYYSQITERIYSIYNDAYYDVTGEEVPHFEPKDVCYDVPMPAAPVVQKEVSQENTSKERVQQNRIQANNQEKHFYRFLDKNNNHDRFIVKSYLINQSLKQGMTNYVPSNEEIDRFIVTQIDGHEVKRVYYPEIVKDDNKFAAMGGMIEEYGNLRDNAILTPESIVYDKAIVANNAKIQRGSVIRGKGVYIGGNAILTKANLSSQIYDKDNSTRAISINDDVKLYDCNIEDYLIAKGNTSIISENLEFTAQVVLENIAMNNDAEKLIAQNLINTQLGVNFTDLDSSFDISSLGNQTYLNEHPDVNNIAQQSFEDKSIISAINNINEVQAFDNDFDYDDEIEYDCIDEETYYSENVQYDEDYIQSGAFEEANEAMEGSDFVQHVEFDDSFDDDFDKEMSNIDRDKLLQNLVEFYNSDNPESFIGSDDKFIRQEIARMSVSKETLATLLKDKDKDVRISARVSLMKKYNSITKVDITSAIAQNGTIKEQIELAKNGLSCDILRNSDNMKVLEAVCKFGSDEDRAYVLKNHLKDNKRDRKLQYIIAMATGDKGVYIEFLKEQLIKGDSEKRKQAAIELGYSEKSIAKMEKILKENSPQCKNTIIKLFNKIGYGAEERVNDTDKEIQQAAQNAVKERSLAFINSIKNTINDIKQNKIKNKDERVNIFESRQYKLSAAIDSVKHYINELKMSPQERKLARLYNSEKIEDKIKAVSQGYKIDAALKKGNPVDLRIAALKAATCHNYDKSKGNEEYKKDVISLGKIISSFDGHSLTNEQNVDLSVAYIRNNFFTMSCSNDINHTCNNLAFRAADGCCNEAFKSIAQKGNIALEEKILKECIRTRSFPDYEYMIDSPELKKESINLLVSEYKAAHAKKDMIQENRIKANLVKCAWYESQEKTINDRSRDEIKGRIIWASQEIGSRLAPILLTECTGEFVNSQGKHYSIEKYAKKQAYQKTHLDDNVNKLSQKDILETKEALKNELFHTFRNDFSSDDLINNSQIDRTLINAIIDKSSENLLSGFVMDAQERTQTMGQAIR